MFRLPFIRLPRHAFALCLYAPILARLIVPLAQAAPPPEPPGSSSANVTGGAAPLVRAITIDARQQAALGVRTSPVQAADRLHLAATASVTVPPGREYTVTAPFAGVITRLDAGLGDAVRAGSPLAHLSSPALAELRRQAREAQLELQNSRAAAERDQAMLDDGLIPAARLQITLNRYRAAESAAQAQVAMLTSGGAQATPEGGDYAGTTVRASGPGQVTETLAAVGQRVEAGAVMFRVADLRELQLDLTLAPEKAARLRVGDVVHIASRDATAEIIGVGRALDASQQAHARARVRVGSNLQSGETLAVVIAARAPAGETSLWQVPARALLSMAGKPRLLRASAQGFELLDARVVSSDDDLAVVAAALKAGDRVASTGLASLRAQLEAGQ